VAIAVPSCLYAFSLTCIPLNSVVISRSTKASVFLFNNSSLVASFWKVEKVLYHFRYPNACRTSNTSDSACSYPDTRTTRDYANSSTNSARQRGWERKRTYGNTRTNRAGLNVIAVLLCTFPRDADAVT
jgi:hypothetical protein